MYAITLNGKGDPGEWRDAARRCLQAHIAPGDIVWRGDGGDEALLDLADRTLPLPEVKQAAPVTVPAAFVGLAEAVICHIDPGRFALLYKLLWRLQQERHLLDIKVDADVTEARGMEKSIRRDCHKMKAFVRFKEVAVEDEAEVQGQRRRRFLAWFEPDHFIVRRIAPFFQRRFTDMDWLIATPKGCASWDGKVLRTTDEAALKPDLKDDADDLWRTYYANIFNPARLKIKAMTAEMPRKYWKNLPEADLIPGLIANAEAQVRAMAARAATDPLPFHHRIQKAALQGQEVAPATAGTLQALKEEASHCTRCDLHCHATQTVFGEGSAQASVMFVGEQPGDQEDLAGRPFVGPAGKVFDQAIGEAGIDRSSVYITNAVKHFKYEPRGKRRIHQRPDMGEVRHCRWWLEREIELVRPKLVVAMGATALFALTESKEKLQDIRGKAIAMQGQRTLFVTVHPSYLLRIPDEEVKRHETARFRADMLAVADLAR